MATGTLKSLVKAGKVSDLWLDLNRKVIKDEFDSKTYQRGDAYQKNGQVTNLSIKGDTLTAEVWGTDSYTTYVTIGLDEYLEEIYLMSDCTCPVETDCKHGVAAALELIINGVSGKLDEKPSSTGLNSPQVNKKAGKKSKKTKSTTDENKAKSDLAILAYLKKKPTADLADYVLELLQNQPAEYQRLREQLILESDDIDQLMVLAHEEIDGLQKRMSLFENYGSTQLNYDFTRIDRYLQRLLKANQAELVLSIWNQMFLIICQSSYRFRKGAPLLKSFACCIPTIRQALDDLSRTELEKLQFWMMPMMIDEYGDIFNADEVLSPKLGKVKFWSSAADALRQILENCQKSERPRFYIGHIMRGSDIVIKCLKQAKREDEIVDIYRIEGESGYHNQRLLNYLMETGAFQEVRVELLRRYKISGEMSDHDRYECLKKLTDLAEKQKDWVTVAGIRTVAFFTETPTGLNYLELIKAAEKVGKKEEVWAAVKTFMETRKLPFQKVDGRLREAKLKQIKNSSDWPLSIPDELWVLIPKTFKYRIDESDVLRLALAGEHLEDVIRLYEKLRAEEANHTRWFPILENFLDIVAKTISKKFPQKSVEYYMEALQLKLTETNQADYHDCASYLEKMYPLFVSMHMEGDWHALLQSIRESYPKRRVFMEILQRMEKALVNKT